MNKKVLDKKALEFNLSYFKNFAPELCAVVKADAYGHGLENVVKILGTKPDFYGVANFDEALRVIKVCPNAKVLLLGKTFSFHFPSNVFFTAMTLKDVRKAIESGLTEKCFIKINSGMNRFGFDCSNEKLMNLLKKLIKKHKFAGLLVHFSSIKNKKVTEREYQNFLKASQFLETNLKICFGGSGAKNLPCDLLRVGIGLYGYGDPNLKKVMQLKSKVLQIRSLEKGERAGYDGFFKAKKRTTLAVVGVGYGDGFERDGAKKMLFEIKGKRYKLVGKFCMDACFVDVTGGDVKVGDEVLAFENADILAKKLKKSHYDVLTNFALFRGKTLKS